MGRSRGIVLLASAVVLLAGAPTRKTASTPRTGSAQPAPSKTPAKKSTTAKGPTAAKPSTTATDPDVFVVPDFGRFLGTWLWTESTGLVATSTPATKGAARTLILNSEMTYEYHQRRGTRDSLLAKGGYLYSEQTAAAGGSPVDYLDFQGWPEKYESRMAADFAGPDTLILGGDCENCPEHTFVRGRSARFEGSVRKGETFRKDLWDGLRFELEPMDLGWNIAVRDSSHPGDDLSSMTPPLHGLNDCFIEGWHFRNQANTGPNTGDVNAPREEREFIFSREVGKTIGGYTVDSDSLADRIDRVERAGRGALTIQNLVLTPPKKGGQAGIESMMFAVAIEEVRGRDVKPSPAKGARP